MLSLPKLGEALQTQVLHSTGASPAFFQSAAPCSCPRRDAGAAAFQRRGGNSSAERRPPPQLPSRPEDLAEFAQVERRSEKTKAEEQQQEEEVALLSHRVHAAVTRLTPAERLPTCMLKRKENQALDVGRCFHYASLQAQLVLLLIKTIRKLQSLANTLIATE